MSLWRKKRIVESLENDGKISVRARNVKYFCQERARVKRFREEAEEGRAGIHGQWQLESPAREYLEQLKCCNDTDCTHSMIKQGFPRPEKWRMGRLQENSQE